MNALRTSTALFRTVDTGDSGESLTVLVVDDSTGLPVKGASVSGNGPTGGGLYAGTGTVTGPKGGVQFDIAGEGGGEYFIAVSAPGYKSKAQGIRVKNAQSGLLLVRMARDDDAGDVPGAAPLAATPSPAPAPTAPPATAPAPLPPNATPIFSAPVQAQAPSATPADPREHARLVDALARLRQLEAIDRAKRGPPRLPSAPVPGATRAPTVPGARRAPSAPWGPYRPGARLFVNDAWYRADANGRLTGKMSQQPPVPPVSQRAAIINAARRVPVPSPRKAPRKPTHPTESTGMLPSQVAKTVSTVASVAQTAMGVVNTGLEIGSSVGSGLSSIL